jgi:mRNA-degrading endonuclease toxin of MazEF toxin-antitoxin module
MVTVVRGDVVVCDFNPTIGTEQEVGSSYAHRD